MKNAIIFYNLIIRLERPAPRHFIYILSIHLLVLPGITIAFINKLKKELIGANFRRQRLMIEFYVQKASEKVGWNDDKDASNKLGETDKTDAGESSDS